MVAQQREPSPPGRPLSLSSSSSGEGAQSSDKKSYLASAESLEDREERRPWDPGLSLSDRVLMEIVDTERTYVRDLHEIIEGYLRHLSSVSPAVIDAQRLADLFSNIEDIWNFNSMFLSELEQCGLDPVAVAGCFVRHANGFNIYTHYCTNYPRTVSILTELMRTPQTAEIFKERQTFLKHSLPLGSYLLKPVQRILKYHLLLQNLVKHHADQEGCTEIKNALSVMTGNAFHINNMKKKHEHAVRVQEIQSLLLGWEGKDLTTYGELVAEGMFRMLRAKAYRHLFLFDKMLLIAKKKDEVMLSYKTHIMCSNLMLIESIQGDPLWFHVIPFDNPRLQYTFQARSLEQKRDWCLQLKRVILENYNAVIPSHARQLVMELGQSRQDTESGGEKLSRRHLLAPEYLERRKQDRRKSEVSTRAGFKLRRGLRKISSQSNNALGDGTSGDTPKLSPVASRKLSEHSLHPNRSWNGNSSSFLDQDSQSRLWTAEETTDTEGEEVVGGLLQYRPSIKSCDSRASDGSLDPSGEYVTFLFAHTYAVRDMEVDPLKEAKSRRELGDQRAHSFSCIENSEVDGPPELPPRQDDLSPTAPEQWLTQQQEHLAPSSTKCGSLPRSFQLSDTLRSLSLECDGHRMRPHTIASDVPQEPEFYGDLPALECKPEPEEAAIPEELPSEETVHPEHKIYVMTYSKYSALKNAFHNVGSKLRATFSNPEAEATPKLGRAASNGSIRSYEKDLSPKVLTAKLVSSVSRVCANMVRSKPSKKGKIVDVFTVTPPIPPPPCKPLPHLPGSAVIGARISNPLESEYCVPKALLASCNLRKNKDEAQEDTRPDSLFSESSNGSSSSSSACDLKVAHSSSYIYNMLDDDDDTPSETSETSADSYYERTFEAIENALNEDMFRDSAIYSDPEEADLSTSAELIPYPSFVEASPRSASHRRCWVLEEESETGSEHSISTIREGSRPGSPSFKVKGWVRHVVEKLQASELTS